MATRLVCLVGTLLRQTLGCENWRLNNSSVLFCSSELTIKQLLLINLGGDAKTIGFSLS